MSIDAAIVAMGCILPQGEGPEALDRVLAGHGVAAAWPDNSRYTVGAVPPGLVPSRPGEDRAATLALCAAEQALGRPHNGGTGGPSLAEVLLSLVPPQRCATVFTISKGGLDLLRREVLPGTPSCAIGEEWFAEIDPASAARAIARRFGLRGPMLATAAACASGGYAMAAGRAMILEGRADVVVCGAADASLQPLVLASYARLGLLPPCDADHRQRGKPFSEDRCGFYVGEGAACFVMVTKSLADQLRLPVMASLCAAATGSAAFSLMAMPTDGEALSHVAATALNRAELDASQLDMIAVHGTATRDGDLNEARALGRLFAPRGCNVPIMVTKDIHGHLLGAACAVETAVAIRAMVTGHYPPSIGDVRVTPGGEIECVRRGGERGAIRRVLKMSAGFGGHLCALVLAR
ncbi:MAG: hypothetical protein JXL80_15385 [Planctomycetes bacterium]|nr:hypothetical protein [Planctomycetota bacterium]